MSNIAFLTRCFTIKVSPYAIYKKLFSHKYQPRLRENIFDRQKQFGAQKRPVSRKLSGRSDIKEKQHDVSVLNNVFFSFRADLARFFASLLAAILDKVIIRNCFRPDKTPLKI